MKKEKRENEIIFCVVLIYTRINSFDPHLNWRGHFSATKFIVDENRRYKKVLWKTAEKKNTETINGKYWYCVQLSAMNKKDIKTRERKEKEKFLMNNDYFALELLRERMKTIKRIHWEKKKKSENVRFELFRFVSISSKTRSKENNLSRNRKLTIESKTTRVLLMAPSNQKQNKKKKTFRLALALRYFDFCCRLSTQYDSHCRTSSHSTLFCIVVSRWLFSFYRVLVKREMPQE